MLLLSPERKRQLGKPKRRWEENIKMDLKEIRWEVVDWIHVAQDTDHGRVLVNTVHRLTAVNTRVGGQNAGNLLSTTKFPSRFPHA
jgi:Lhr-like helicase